MGDRTGIAWTEATWNPVTGCDKVSEGCDHCYAEHVAHRFAGTAAYPDGFKVTLRPERLEQPLRWRRPRMIFVNSMSDLFHPQVSDDYLDQVFDVMERAPHHTFQVLTKRHARMRSYLRARAEKCWAYADKFEACPTDAMQTSPAASSARRRALEPLPRHIWVGVSVETQKWADIRIPALLDTPAAVRFLSCEPLLGPVQLWSSMCRHALQWRSTSLHPPHHRPDCCPAAVAGLDWVIVGGESGTGARRMDPAWATALADECAAAGVAFFMKQTGTVLAKEWGLPGKGEDPTSWPFALPQAYPA